MTVRVRVGIVSWNTADLLDRCLAALPTALAGIDAEVVVVDNASSDGSADVAARHAAITVVRNDTNEGYARGMNRALAAGDADVLVALNPDAVPPPGSIASLVRALDEAPDVGLVVPRLRNSDGSVQHTVYRFPSLAVAAAVAWLPARLHGGPIGRRFCLEGHTPHDAPGDIDWAIGAVHVIRRSALGGDLPYRERWFMYVEDLDLCWRLRRRGWRVRLDPSVDIPHVGNASGAQAWGTARTARWLDATYDWYALEHGPLAARAWGLVNAGGIALNLVATRAALALRLPGSRERRWWRYGELRTWLDLHVERIRRRRPVDRGRATQAA
jgi:GT2 family glycosyltransferase